MHDHPLGGGPQSKIKNEFWGSKPRIGKMEAGQGVRGYLKLFLDVWKPCQYIVKRQYLNYTFGLSTEGRFFSFSLPFGPGSVTFWPSRRSVAAWTQ
jgi:hypothetical protein